MLLARTSPDEPLLEHLLGVGALAEGYLAPLGLGEEGRLAGLCHDLGKATPYFQEMLAGQRAKGDPLTWHALLGALYAAWTARQRGMGEKSLLLFLAVLEHHGSLKTPWERIPLGPRQASEKAWKILPKQIRALQESPLFPALVADLGLPPPEAFLGEGAWEEAERLAREADALLDREGRDLGLHYRLALLYSALLDADRRLAGQAPPKGEGIPIPPEAAEAHLARKSRPTPLSPQREALFRGVGEVLEGPLERVFPARLTLTAPTGAGKTLAALRFALALRERVHRERGFRPKVVYALPYIAIADQVEEEARGVLQAAGLKPEEHLLVHHHLALAREEEGSVEEALLLQETWDAEVVVTTFHQLFPTLVGPGSALRPLHALAKGAILILDEVQTLPAELWPFLGELLRQLPGQMTVISMTATQPGLVKGQEVAPHLPSYPRRVRLAWHGARTLEELGQALLQEGPKSRLVVVNTVREAMSLYRFLREEGLPHLYLLTSHIIPKHRKARLEEIRAKLQEGQPLTLVATQVVEAGVDLDFQEGYRAFAPMESILQVAGRVNRSALGEGRLWVLDLEGDGGRRVYGTILLDRSRRVLGPRLAEGLWDLEAYALLPQYYRLVEEGISQAKGQDLLAKLARLDYSQLRFTLIEEAPSIPIFIEWDQEATRLLGELEGALTLKDPGERRKRLRPLLARIQGYTVSPLLQRALKNLPPPLLGREEWRHVPREAVADFYDEEMGFLWEMEQFL